MEMHNFPSNLSAISESVKQDHSIHYHHLNVVIALTSTHLLTIQLNGFHGMQASVGESFPLNRKHLFATHNNPPHALLRQLSF